MKKQYIVGVFIILILVVPVFARAATADEIFSQIQSLLARVTSLQTELAALTYGSSTSYTNNSSGTTTVASSSRPCPALYRALTRGSRGSDITALQQFLVAEGVLSADAVTGYFGPATEAAVKQWQAKNGIVSSGDAFTTGYGSVGAATRMAIVARCREKEPDSFWPPINATTTRNCPLLMPPYCPNGTLLSKGLDSNGCSRGFECKTATSTTPTCPAIAAPQASACPNGTWVSKGFDSMGCNKGYECRVATTTPPCPPVMTQQAPYCPNGTIVPKVSNSCVVGYECKTATSTPPACPVFAAPLASACPNGTWIPKGKDSRGCDMGYQCKTATSTTPCPAVMTLQAPYCPNGTIVPKVSNSCVIGYECKTATSTPPTCPVPMPPYCPNGVLVASSTTTSNGCRITTYQCKPKTSCTPVDQLPICTDSSLMPTYGSNGCLACRKPSDVVCPAVMAPDCSVGTKLETTYASGCPQYRCVVNTTTPSSRYAPASF